MHTYVRIIMDVYKLYIYSIYFHNTDKMLVIHEHVVEGEKIKSRFLEMNWITNKRKFIGSPKNQQCSTVGLQNVFAVVYIHTFRFLLAIVQIRILLLIY